VNWPRRAAVLLLLSQPALAGLPLAAERATVLQYCTACHALDRVLHSGGSKPIWADRINRMVRWGAKIPVDEIGPVAAYLASALPVRLAPPPSPAFFANTAVSTVVPQSVHVTLRVAASFDAGDRTLQMWLDPGDARRVTAGQHVRAFSPHARAVMITARVTQVAEQGSRSRVIAKVSTAVDDPAQRYVAEIGLDLGVLLAIPNEGIIYDGDSRIVYVVASDGGYERRVISTGAEGEKLTEIVKGLVAGEQIVTVGGFFIDAAYRMAALSR